MRRLRIIVFFAVALGAVAAANYFLYANPPAIAPLAPVNAVSLGSAATDDSKEKLPASELLLVHTQTRNGEDPHHGDRADVRRRGGRSR